jgi:hypothetical protein
MDEYTYEELAEEARIREEAEKAGVFDDDSRLSVAQEQELWIACSTLSNLAKETNSTVSELLKVGGLV